MTFWHISKKSWARDHLGEMFLNQVSLLSIGLIEAKSYIMTVQRQFHVFDWAQSAAQNLQLLLSVLATLTLWCDHYIDPAITRPWTNVGSLFVQRRRRWTNSDPTFVQCLVFSGNCLQTSLLYHALLSSDINSGSNSISFFHTSTNIDQMLSYCWISVLDAGPTVRQYWINVRYFLGSDTRFIRQSCQYPRLLSLVPCGAHRIRAWSHRSQSYHMF